MCGFKRLSRPVLLVARVFLQSSPAFAARNLGHSAAIYKAQGVLYDVRVAEGLPRRLHGVPSPVGAARGTEAAPAFLRRATPVELPDSLSGTKAARPRDNARRREGPRRADEKQCRTYL